MKTVKFKRAMLMLTLLVMTLSAVTGGTIAWFTDSVESNVNVISAGNLDVDVYYDGTKSIEKVDELFKDVTLWEPGAVAWENLDVVNKGNLALKYEMVMNTANENTVDGNGLSTALKVGIVKDGVAADAKRDAVIGAVSEWKTFADFKATGKLYPADSTLEIPTDAKKGSETYGVVIYWQPSADDNKWNVNNDKVTSDSAEHLHIDLGIILEATQLDAEDDSFGNDYDKDLNPTENYIFSGKELHNSTTKSGELMLMADVQTSAGGDDARYGWGYEYIVRKGADYTLDLNGKTITHDTVNENANKNAFTYLFVANHAGTKLTINGEGKVYSNNSEGYTCAVQGKDGTLITINGGDYQVDNGIAVWAGAGSHIIINDGSFVNGNAKTDHELIYSSGGVIDIYGGFFHNTDGNYTLNVEDRNRATGFINVYGGTYVNFDPSTGGQDPNNIKVADGYKVVSETQENGDIWYTVVPE